MVVVLLLVHAAWQSVHNYKLEQNVILQVIKPGSAEPANLIIDCYSCPLAGGRSSNVYALTVI
jgi:hypothetical protein